MARNGSGTYGLPAGNPVVTGTVISSTWANTTFSDVATALTNSIAKDGQTVPTANLPMGGFRHTGVQNGSAATDYAALGQSQNAAFQYIGSISGADTITGALTPTLTAYAAGQTFRFVSAGANTGAVTINIDSLGAKAVTKNGSTALIAGDIPSGALVQISYDGTRFQLSSVGGVSASSIQDQTYIAYTTGGTSTAFTLTPSPALTALAENQEFDVEFNAAAGATPTLAISGLTAKSLKYRDSTGAKQDATSAQIPSGWRSKVVYDGTDYIVREIPLPSTSTPPARQTVLSGPVDSSGLAAFGGSTGSTTVTASGTLNVTAAYIADNRIGAIVNPSWTGLNAGGDGTKFAYIDIASDGSCTTGFVGLRPEYQWGGAYSITNGQCTFNIQEMTMKVGNGSVAAQVWRVFVGDFTVSGGVVTAITWYALMGRYFSQTATGTVPTTTRINANHNLGLFPRNIRCTLVCMSAEGGYSSGNEIEIQGMTSAGETNVVSFGNDTHLAMGVTAKNPAYIWNKSTGALFAFTAGNWATRFYADRGW